MGKATKSMLKSLEENGKQKKEGKKIEDDFQEDDEEDLRAYILNKFLQNKSMNDKNVSYTDDGRTEINEEHETVKDLNRLKLLGYELLPGEILSDWTKSVSINKKEALKEKIDEIIQSTANVYKDLTKLPWLETLDVSTNITMQDWIKLKKKEKENNEETSIKSENERKSFNNYTEDLEREAIFHDMTLVGIREGLRRIKLMGLEFSRPNDFMSEMFKSDEQMKKVKQKLIDEDEQIKAIEEKKRKRFEKKFHKKSQNKFYKLQEEGRRKNENLRKIDEWKRQRFSNLLKNSKGEHLNIETAEEDLDKFLMTNEKSSLSLKKNKKYDKNKLKNKKGRLINKSEKRIEKDKKFGFGGVKKFKRKNTKQSRNENHKYTKVKKFNKNKNKKSF